MIFQQSVLDTLHEVRGDLKRLIKIYEGLRDVEGELPTNHVLVREIEFLFDSIEDAIDTARSWLE